MVPATDSVLEGVIPLYRQIFRNHSLASLHCWENGLKAHKISPHTLRLAIDHGQITADHLLGDGPWIISREILDGEAAKKLK